MRVIQAGAKPAFALFIIGHGLLHVRLPIDEFLDSSQLAIDFVPLILLNVAVLGFIIGGLGILGLRAFAAMMRPAMVLASAYSLVLMWRFGQGDILWGAAVDVMLFFTFLTAAYRYLPDAHDAPTTQSATPASARG